MPPMPSRNGPGPVHAGKLAGRRARNAALRAIGEEPVPGAGAGVKRHARFLKRALHSPITVKPVRALRYMHAHARRQAFAEATGIA